MHVFNHLLYEYQKGLRGLALHTFHTSKRDDIVYKLKRQAIDYHIQVVSERKMNIFFGSTPCVEVVKQFGTKPLNQYTCEEDFILGIMLGYDRENQCKRYLKIKDKINEKQKKIEHQQTFQLLKVAN